MSTEHAKVRIGNQSIDEIGLTAEMTRVTNEIETWGKQNELWHDTRFAILSPAVSSVGRYAAALQLRLTLL